MSILDAIILGIIEGLSEFLPISSTGHMILARPLLGIDGNAPVWHAFLFISQFGAILAVVLLFWRELWHEGRKLTRGPIQNHLFFKVGVAMIPAALLLVLGINKYMEEHFESNIYAVAGALIVGAVIMEVIDRFFRSKIRMSIDEINWRQALFIGAAQCIAAWPGTSRSMATIMAGMVVGLSPRVATEFSFYLAIPTMLGAAAVKIIKHHHELTGDNATVILVGSATAMLVALAVVAGFLRYVRTRRFTPFAIYRVVLGALVLWLARPA